METEAPCDPALLSCITADEIQKVLPFVFIVLGALAVWHLIRFDRKKHNGPARTRGTAPGMGDTVNSINMSSHGRGRDHQGIVRHTKDPQKHAQAMMPAKARKKDQTK